MKLLKWIILSIAKRVHENVKKNHINGVANQVNTFNSLIAEAKTTSFGKDHDFQQVQRYYDFINQVSIQDYESLKPYVDRARSGEKNVLWSGRPLYFAKTSGTTSGSKFIPLTKVALDDQIKAARNSLFAYVNEKNNADFFLKKMIFLQGSPVMNEENGIQIGRLSGIVYHHVPKWLSSRRMPSYETNCIEDWDEKVDAIVEETAKEDMSLLSGIPPWCIMYFERLLAKTGAKDLKSLYPNLQLYVYGGVNYRPYQEKIQALLGPDVDTLETYPASEGFFAYQDSQTVEGLMLNLNAGIFYEFVKSADIHKTKPTRVHLGGVELGVDYVLIVSTNAGLWAYNTGDTIKFVSAYPYRIVVTGRVKHFISAFGEHVIQEEVEKAITHASEKLGISFVEFTVAPRIAETEGESCHEWFVEFTEDSVSEFGAFAEAIDKSIQSQNSYYRDLREGGMLSDAIITPISKHGFARYFESQGKVGGQNKVQHLANNRELADKLTEYVKKG